ncbi:MAG: hypothetical protein CMP86_06040 [Gammaproteobacteria bacterium]|nr:hypothetical protein [Gammaproteobacteria bacterium]
MIHHETKHAGTVRNYYVYVPSSYDGETALPVMIGLHGYTSTASGFATSHGLDQHAERHGYIAVFPQGSSFSTSRETGLSETPVELITSWNDLAANFADSTGVMHCLPESHNYPCPPTCGDCTQCMWTSCGDDLGYLDQMLTEVKSRYRTDSSRYYVLGVSNGAMMALRWACDRSNEFAAVASIIGQLAPGFACQPTTKLPLMHLTGALDDVVREDGKPAADGYIYETAARTQAHWASALGCQSHQPWQTSDPKAAGLQCMTWTQCDVTDHEVIGCSDPKGTHAWPGASVGTMSAVCVSYIQSSLFPQQPRCTADPEAQNKVWGVDLVWDFFNRYRRELNRS